MADSEKKIFVLDAAYAPFPSFQEFNSRIAIDATRWDRYNASLRQLLGPDKTAINRAYEVVKRASAIDTGAIEGLYEVDRGFTYTIAFETAAWESAISQKGENVRPLFEAQLRAYEYVLDLATKAEPISEAAIRRLHEVVCEAQKTYRVTTAVGPQEQTLPKGQYKSLPNHVRTRKGTDHSYAPVDVTPTEMERLVQEMRTGAFINAHPILQAAYAHYALVVIHPFPDGNGRVARALASAFTYRSISMPIMILSEHKASYLDALEDADFGKLQRFFDFMMARSLDTIKLVEESTRNAALPTSDQSLAALEELYITRGGYKQEQIDQAGSELLNRVYDALKGQLLRIQSESLNITVNLTTISYGDTTTHRLPIADNQGQRPNGVSFNLFSAPPANAQIFGLFVILLPRDASGDDDALIAPLANPGQIPQEHGALTARIEELIPTFSGVFQIRLSMFAERVVAEALSKLTLLAKQKIHRV